LGEIDGGVWAGGGGFGYGSEWGGGGLVMDRGVGCVKCGDA
jgi:hypothetical protein